MAVDPGAELAEPTRRVALSAHLALVQWMEATGRARAGLQHQGRVTALLPFPDEPSPAVRAAVGETLSQLAPVILGSLVEAPVDPAVLALAGLDGQALEALFAMPGLAAFATETVPVSTEPRQPVTVTFAAGPTELRPTALAAMMSQTLSARLPEWFRAGRILFEPLTSDAVSMTVSPIVLDSRWLAFVCVEQPTHRLHLVIARISPSQISTEALLLDHGRLCLLPRVRRAPDRRPAVDFAIRTLCKIALLHGRRLRRWIAAPDKRLALMLHPESKAHLGHFIWNEMCALEQALLAAPGDPPTVYAPGRTLDTAFYGPLEDLYPEFEGRVERTANEADAFRRSILNREAILPCAARRTLLASRRRIQAAVANDPDAALMSPAAEAFGRDPETGRARPVVIFSLRLQNRTLPDPESFFLACARALCDRFGSVGILLDGLNGLVGRSQGRSYKLHNVEAPKGETLSPLAREQALAARFRAAVAGERIDTISLVGSTMRTNLLWMSKADFFVAFQGAGLAKLRWALAKPGYVLTSQANLTACRHLRIYDHDDFMEPIAEPLHLNGLDDVRDLTGSNAPAKPSVIPHPENFDLIDPQRTIARIVDLCAEAFAGFETRPTPRIASRPPANA